MSDLTVIQRTQKIYVDMASASVAVVNAGPQGPGGPEGWNHFTFSETAPVSPTVEDMWIRISTGVMYAYFDDGDTTDWHEVSRFEQSYIDVAELTTETEMINAFVGKTGNQTMTGTLTLSSNLPYLVFSELDTSTTYRQYVQASGIYLEDYTSGILTARLLSYNKTTHDLALGGTIGVDAVNVLVPTPTQPLHAANKAYTDTALALKANLSGPVFTGDIRLDKASPIITVDANTGNGVILFQLNGVSSKQIAQLSDGKLRLYDYVSGRSSLVLESDGTINLTGALAVTVPTPTANTHAASKTYVDTANALKANLAGGAAFTGNVSISNTFPGLTIVDTDGTADQRRTDILQNGGVTSLRVANDAGVPVVAGIQIANATGAVTFNTPSVTVPTPTAFAHAANGFIRGTGSPEGVVTATVGMKYIDTAATYGAIEWIKASGSGNTGWRVTFGDTNWRVLLAWNSSGVFTTGSAFSSSELVVRTGTAGSVRIRRKNDNVTAVVSNIQADATGIVSSAFAEIITVPSGFRPSISEDSAIGSYNQITPQAPLRAQASGAFGYQTTAAVSANGLLTAWASTHRWTTDTGVPWPTSLPGIAG